MDSVLEQMLFFLFTDRNLSLGALSDLQCEEKAAHKKKEAKGVRRDRLSIT